jgi:hypothetical protein
MPHKGKKTLGLRDLARRITGFSTPFFGVSWNPPAAERDTVRGFLTFLEDRRVLFNPDYASAWGAAGGGSDRAGASKIGYALRRSGITMPSRSIRAMLHDEHFMTVLDIDGIG